MNNTVYICRAGVTFVQRTDRKRNLTITNLNHGTHGCHLRLRYVKSNPLYSSHPHCCLTSLIGNLGSAITKALLEPRDKDQLQVKRLITTVYSAETEERVKGDFKDYTEKLTIKRANENASVAKEADLVILAFKPVKREGVFSQPGFREALQGTLVISIMAGVSLGELDRLVTDDGKISYEKPFQAIRVMPNMAARIREAVSLYTADPATITEESLQTADWVLNQFGTSEFLEESQFDISSVLVGCAGSLLLLAIDGLLDAAVAEGVRRPAATKMAMQSAIGMMRLVPELGEHPSVLREKIASPGGCSIRALLELEKLGVRSAFTSAVLKAAERSRSISKR